MIKTQEASLLDVFCTRVQVLQGFEHVNFCPYETSLPLYSPIAPRKCPLRKVCQRVCMHLSGCACMRLLCVCAWMKGFCCKGCVKFFVSPPSFHCTKMPQERSVGIRRTCMHVSGCACMPMLRFAPENPLFASRTLKPCRAMFNHYRLVGCARRRDVSCVCVVTETMESSSLCLTGRHGGWSFFCDFSCVITETSGSSSLS